MPWTVKDVDRHKKGLASAQKKKWVSIANGVLKDCQSKGGSGCEGKAIRIANSKFNKEYTMPEDKQVPKGALRFVDEGQGCQAFVEFEGTGWSAELEPTDTPIWVYDSVTGNYQDASEETTTFEDTFILARKTGIYRTRGIDLNLSDFLY